MQAREEFHKRARGHRIGVLFAALGWGVTSGCGPADSASGQAGGPALRAEPASVSTPRPPVGHAWVIVGADTIVAEVAATPQERSEGLMYRDEVPDGTGMLFVFPDNQIRSFWMANTYVPLDIAYLDPSFRVVDIQQMEPLVTDSYVSRAPAMYGLEVRQRWFSENGIGVGAQAEIVFGVARR
jgi:uncharacterized membrane protein (UPF0127 family)